MAQLFLWTVGLAASLAGIAVLLAAASRAWRDRRRFHVSMLIALAGLFLLAVGLPLLRTAARLAGPGWE